tara:strand:- start:202 stop:492 length:291 start_codon:yes stop_codon:yes gene_type:complete
MSIDIENWLGKSVLFNQFYKYSGAKRKLRKHKVQGDWLFINTDYGHGKALFLVEAYCLNPKGVDIIYTNMCHDRWPSKGFNWSEASLAKKVERLEA